MILTGPSPARLRGTVDALKKGRKLTVVAPDPIFDFLGKQGAVTGGSGPRQVDDVKIDGLLYAPAPGNAGALGQFLQASVAAARPRATLRRLAESARIPNAEPWIVEITFPDGARLLHLDLALHKETDPAWVDRAIARFGGPEWLIVGVPWGDGESVVSLAPRFAARRILVAELQNTERREAGLPTELVTPVRDRLLAAGIEAHVFATQASYRFE